VIEEESNVRPEHTGGQAPAPRAKEMQTGFATGRADNRLLR
jgi:hypothetical protein